MKLLPSLFSCVYSRVELFVFAMNSRRRHSIFVSFIYGLEEKNSKSEVVFAVCRLPSAVCRLPSAVCRLPSAINVMLNLSNISLVTCIFLEYSTHQPSVECVYQENTSDSWDTPWYPTRKRCITRVHCAIYVIFGVYR